MGHDYRNNGPLPSLKEKSRKEKELGSLGIDPERRKFSTRDLLIRIANHEPGQKVLFRTEDHPLITSLEETGLVTFSESATPRVAERTALKIPEAQFQALTYTLEEKIANLREKLKKVAPEGQTA